MIPAFITKIHLTEALRRIVRDGIPPQRRSRKYCLVANGNHFPPKQAISIAHAVATGEFLSPHRFSGGVESNDFLRRRGFDVVKCGCGGGVEHSSVTSAVGPSLRRYPAMGRTAGQQGVALPRDQSLGTEEPTIGSVRHSERCRECKTRVRQLLRRIYGTCLPNYRFDWGTGFSAYEGTPMDPVLRAVAAVLDAYRGFAVDNFVRADTLAPCDFWVPDPGFIVEFDESQHFTAPRKLALRAYASQAPLGFSAERWVALCEQHDAKDNHPPFRDEQRAWYDTLRDLVPSIKGFQPTVRLYARDCAWCSLDPDNHLDRKRFSDLMGGPSISTTRGATTARRKAPGKTSTLNAAMVFPTVSSKSSNGVPPGGSGAQQPVVPAAPSFAGEAIDFVLFPEGYIRVSDVSRITSLKQLASDLGAPLLVGAIDDIDATGRDWQVLLRFESDGSAPFRVYVKHSTAGAVAFELHDWDSHDRLPIFELGGVGAGATICHDHYLGLLPRFLAARGARLWVNPSFDNVTDIKWSSVLRLRAVENRFFALCTLHCCANGRRTHPFGFAPDGGELSARQPGADAAWPLSECSEAGNIYMIELDMDLASKPLDWSKIPPAEPKRPGGDITLRKTVRIKLKDGRPAVLGRTGWKSMKADKSRLCVETKYGPIHVGVVSGERILDAADCFHVLDSAKRIRAAPIIWNHWERLPADSARLATLMMGRSIECCAPVVISARESDRVCELVELSGNYKIPVRRILEPPYEAVVDVRYARGLDHAFQIVTKHLPRNMGARALDRYRSLARSESSTQQHRSPTD